MSERASCLAFARAAAAGGVDLGDFNARLRERIAALDRQFNLFIMVSEQEPRPSNGRLACLPVSVKENVREPAVAMEESSVPLPLL